MRIYMKIAGLVCTLMILLLMSAAYCAVVKGKTTLYYAYSPDWSASAGWTDGADYYYYWFDAGTTPTTTLTATCQISVSEAGLYDIYIGPYVREDYTADARYIVNFKSGGAYYQVENEKRVNSYDNTNAASGQVKISATLVDPGNPLLRDAIFLGRYEFDASTYDLVVTTDGMTASGFTVTPWLGVAGPQAVKPTAPYYQDIDAVIPFWWMNFDDPDQYYWGGHPANPSTYNYLVDTKFFCFPSSDRAVSGYSDVNFTEVYGTSASPPDQPVDLPIILYFEPGTSYTPPAISGMITAVDESRVSDGIIIIDVNTQSAGTTSLGNYYFDGNKTYGAKIDDWPLTYSGLGDVFIRKFEFSLPDLGVPPTPTPVPMAGKDWIYYE